MSGLSMLFSVTVSDEGTAMWPKEAAGAECQKSLPSSVPKQQGALCSPFIKMISSDYLINPTSPHAGNTPPGITAQADDKSARHARRCQTVLNECKLFREIVLEVIRWSQPDHKAIIYKQRYKDILNVLRTFLSSCCWRSLYVHGTRFL